jgi:hypothetical protein
LVEEGIFVKQKKVSKKTKDSYLWDSLRTPNQPQNPDFFFIVLVHQVTHITRDFWHEEMWLHFRITESTLKLVKKIMGTCIYKATSSPYQK